MGDLRAETVLEALRGVSEPEIGEDVVSLGMIRDVEVEGGSVRFTLELTTPASPCREELQRRVAEAVRGLPGVAEVRVEVTARVRSTRPALGPDILPGVRNIVAVGSGKGGVGKSTVAANLAAALAAEGAAVGLLDADIYGPSIPGLMGIRRREVGMDRETRELLPAVRYGLQIMSMGLLVAEGQSVIWRGPMLDGVLRQFLNQVRWGELDYLVVDLPPGTGDVALSLCQKVPVGGAVVVSTPQDVACRVAVKAIDMFSRLNTPVVGLVENMSYYVCPHCAQREDLFGHGGARAISERMGIPFLGEIPLASAVRSGGDEGRPVVLARPESPAGRAFLQAARLLAGRLSVAAVRGYEHLEENMPGVQAAV